MSSHSRGPAFRCPRAFALVVAVWAVLLCATGCHGKRTRASERVLGSEKAWYQQAWGQPPGKAEIDASKRRIDCLWREVSHAGGDPVKDLDCFARRLDAMRRCYSSHEHEDIAKAAHHCRTAFESACEVSAAFERASRSTCKASPAHRRAPGSH